jgi:hypothetical protein
VAGTRLCFDAICIPLALLPRIHDFRGLLPNRRYTRRNQSDRGWGWVDRGRLPPDSPLSLPLHSSSKHPSDSPDREFDSEDVRLGPFLFAPEIAPRFLAAAKESLPRNYMLQTEH